MKIWGKYVACKHITYVKTMRWQRGLSTPGIEWKPSYLEASPVVRRRMVYGETEDIGNKPWQSLDLIKSGWEGKYWYHLLCIFWKTIPRIVQTMDLTGAKAKVTQGVIGTSKVAWRTVVTSEKGRTERRDIFERQTSTVEMRAGDKWRMTLDGVRKAAGNPMKRAAVSHGQLLTTAAGRWVGILATEGEKDGNMGHKTVFSSGFISVWQFKTVFLHSS